MIFGRPNVVANTPGVAAFPHRQAVEVAPKVSTRIAYDLQAQDDAWVPLHLNKLSLPADHDRESRHMLPLQLLLQVLPLHQHCGHSLTIFFDLPSEVARGHFPRACSLVCLVEAELFSQQRAAQPTSEERRT